MVALSTVMVLSLLAGVAAASEIIDVPPESPDPATTTEMVSIRTDKGLGNDRSFPSVTSADGSVVAFTSSASNLVPGDNNNASDIFVHDRTTGKTTRVSVSSAGVEANSNSSIPAISADGQRVAFASSATNLIDAVTLNPHHKYVHDISTGKTTLVSVNSSEEPAEAAMIDSAGVSLSANGRYVAFSSSGRNLNRKDTNALQDIYVRDLEKGITTRVTTGYAGPMGAPTNGDSTWPSISHDGRYVAYTSRASNLIRGDDNGAFDVFVTDRATGDTKRVSVDSEGREAAGAHPHSTPASISGDGGTVVFQSYATNLVPNDGNGKPDIFSHHVLTGITSRISVTNDGTGANGVSQLYVSNAVSTNGRYVLFTSDASNLTPQSNGSVQVYVHDMVEGTNRMVSVRPDGSPAYGHWTWESSVTNYAHSISADGRFVTFSSIDPQLTGRTDDNDKLDVYIRRIRSDAESYTLFQWDDPREYVALGDSYQSGHGTLEYYPETNDECQRSPYAYAPLLVADGIVEFDLEFAACSGARTYHFYEGGQYGEGSQLEELGPDTALVTIGIGGNDLDFAAKLQDCIKSDVTGPVSCQERYDAEVEQALQELTTPDPVTGLNTFQRLYDDITKRAPEAETYTLGYPRWFPVEGAQDWTSWVLTGDDTCAGLDQADQMWANYKIKLLDEAIATSARSLGLEYVDLYDSTEGREICNPSHNDPMINGVTVHGGLDDLDEAYHPNELAHRVFADILTEAITSVALQWEGAYLLGPYQTIIVPTPVRASTPAVSFSTDWPGSDVVMTLTSPSGRVIGRDVDAPDVVHRVGPTHEVYLIEDPEAGEWKVELYGADVDPAGEPTKLEVYEVPKPNEEPVPSFTMTREGHTVTLDASASRDPDGQVESYLWELGDGTLLTGEQVTHTYRETGTFDISLVVVDNRGGMGFTSLQHPIVVEPYRFTGFYGPVNNRPTLNTVQSGRAIPVKFSLGGNQGLHVFDVDSPRVQTVDCATGVPLDEVELTVAAGNSSLSYDATRDEYTYVWKTETWWAGSCRRLVVALNDGTSHSADFKLR